VALQRVVESVIHLLKGGTVHTMHPAYFGLFNPSVLFPAMLADQISAAFNPQLAVWSHAPAAIEIERHTIAAMAGRFGWSDGTGHFTTGGTESNATSLLMALSRTFPQFGQRGVGALSGQPRLYVSAESHLAWLKIAHQTGIGRNSVHLVATDGMGRMDPLALSEAIRIDREKGHIPFFVGATAGTTNAGMIDPLEACGDRARAEALWFHVDAAWGGAAILSAQAADHLKGIGAADSITLDAHKWLAVPMGAGMLLCRDEMLLGEIFRVSASYMPTSTDAGVDPYTHSIQWSRRFIGLKLFMSLACLGWRGYQTHIEHTLAMAAQLRGLLCASGWRIVNDSPLGVVCFEDSAAGTDPAVIAARVVASGDAWISPAMFEGRTVLRACITSHFTTSEHLGGLVDALARARRAEI